MPRSSVRGYQRLVEIYDFIFLKILILRVYLLTLSVSIPLCSVNVLVLLIYS
jgi:hypothetical protein